MKWFKYFLIIILCISVINSYSQIKIIKGKLAKSLFEFIVDSVLIKYDGVNPNSSTPNFIKSNMGFCCYNSTCKEEILFELNKIDSKKSKEILEKISFESKLDNRVIKKKNFLVVDSCPTSRLYTTHGKMTCSAISFSTPIFFAKNKYCLVSYILFNFGEATLMLRRQNKKWTIYKRMCEYYN